MMDTRSRIVTVAHAVEIALDLRRRGTPVTALTGLFDVLQAGMVERIAALSREQGVLMALVADDPDAIVPLTARVELAAALRGVDYVVPVTDANTLTALMHPARVVDYSQEDRALRSKLIENVRRKHGK
jgi:bifunctional ADP-heptose synthase (sugar kinase/adenylyltransferase)